jgi:hypothetical protein
LASAFLLVACACGGCGSKLELPLRLNRTEVDIGSVWAGGQAIEVPLKLRVWDKSPVTIEETRSSCGCVSMAPAVTQQELAPGSEHDLVLAVNPPHQPGVARIEVLFFTRPVSQQPLKLIVKSRVRLAPEVVPRTLALTVPLGVRPEATLHVHYDREATDSRLALDDRRSVFGPLSLRTVDIETDEFTGLRQHERRDHVALKLEGREDLPLGEHAGEIKLAWKGGLPETVVPVRLRIMHPLRPALQRLFCGILQAGQQWSTEVELVRLEQSARVTSVTSDQSFIRAQLLPGDRLVVHVTAPAAPGRWEGVITLAYGGAKVPEVHLPVSGVVD